MPQPFISVERLRRHGVSLLLVAVAPVAALAVIVLGLTAAARPQQQVLESVASPSSVHVAVVQQRGEGSDAGYRVDLQTGAMSVPVACVVGGTASVPRVQWVGDDALQVSVLDGGRPVATTVRWHAGAAHEEPARQVLHSC